MIDGKAIDTETGEIVDCIVVEKTPDTFDVKFQEDIYMTQHDFGEKAEEYNSKTGKNVPVWQSPKYKMARDKAIEMIDSGKYNLSDGDFWILMNLTKSGKMMYSGLIISHNGCLKINDNLNEDMKFKPGCVTLDKDGQESSVPGDFESDWEC